MMRDEFADDPRTRGYLHLAHHKSEESFDRMWTDTHLAGDLLARHPLNQKLQRLALSWSQPKQIQRGSKIDRSTVRPLEPQGVRWMRG